MNLDNGIGNAIANVGVLDGFLGNALIRIPLPKVLQDVQSYLQPLGADGLLVELQQQLNRGAEKAAPIAKDIFVGAVRDLTITDALNIVRGPDNAATQYLADRTTTKLASLFSPIMENNTWRGIWPQRRVLLYRRRREGHSCKSR